jgi:hypothetical protein
MATTSARCRIDEIAIGERHRKEMGDIPAPTRQDPTRVTARSAERKRRHGGTYEAAVGDKCAVSELEWEVHLMDIPAPRTLGRDHHTRRCRPSWRDDAPIARPGGPK